MKLIVHIHVVPGEPFDGLPTYDEVRMLYDSGTYGRIIRIGNEFTIRRWERIQGHLEGDTPQEITHVVRYPTRDGITKLGFSTTLRGEREWYLHHFRGKSRVSPIVHDKVRKLRLSSEPLIL